MPLNGPEDVPLKEYQREFFIVVIVKEQNGTVLRMERMNYSEANERKWLGRLSYWAYSNNKVVETMSQSCYDVLKNV